jgi:hypothetical protein
MCALYDGMMQGEAQAGGDRLGHDHAAGAGASEVRADERAKVRNDAYL